MEMLFKTHNQMRWNRDFLIYNPKTYELYNLLHILFQCFEARGRILANNFYDTENILCQGTHLLRGSPFRDILSRERKIF